MTQTAEPVFERICALLRTHAKTEAPLTREARIVTDLEIDSVEVFDLIMEIEDTYDLSFPMEVVTDIHTIGELVDTVERLKNA